MLKKMYMLALVVGFVATVNAHEGCNQTTEKLEKIAQEKKDIRKKVYTLSLAYGASGLALGAYFLTPRDSDTTLLLLYVGWILGGVKVSSLLYPWLTRYSALTLEENQLLSTDDYVAHHIAE